jgi:hypothetical protein
MSKEVEVVPRIGTDGRLLPVLPPERDPRLSIRVIRVMFYTPGILALLLLKSGEPTGFGLTIEFLMLASAASVVAGLFIATQSSGRAADAAAKVGTWSGALVLELLGVVSFLNAVPPLFHQLAHSELLKSLAPGAQVISLGHTEFIPAVAILPFMLYQLAGFGTLHYVVSNTMNWLINLAILALIVIGYVGNREGNFTVEMTAGVILVLMMAVTVVYGVLQLKAMQTQYDAHRPPKEGKKHHHDDEAEAAPPV